MTDKIRIRIGREFDLEATISTRSQIFLQEIMRSIVCFAIVVAGLLVLFAAMIYGLATGDFTYISVTWSALALPIGAIVGFYFPSRQRAEVDGQKNDEGSA